MANAVFTTKVSPVYDDLPELQYHFPKTYLRQATQAIGDLIVYYEPRREGASLSGRAGRQAYFAVARVSEIVEDPRNRDSYYALMRDYLEFDETVPFRVGKNYFESALQKPDGSTNKGAFGRAVRTMPTAEFQAICRAGFSSVKGSVFVPDTHLADEPAPLDRFNRRQLQERSFRDASFGRTIFRAYSGICAMTGLRLHNGNGCFEVEAAHIKPVSELGPDSPRNGIALSQTIHWMFDQGIISISDEGDILTVKKLLPEKVRSVLKSDMKVSFPVETSLRPHVDFLRYHREKKFNPRFHLNC